MPQKTFVRQDFRQKNQKVDKPDPPKQPKKHTQKSYTQKTTLKVDPVKQMMETQITCSIPTNAVRQAIQRFEPFFNKDSLGSQKRTDAHQNLTQFTHYSKKRQENYYKRDRQKQNQLLSEDEPDWDSDDNIQGNLQSKKIQIKIVEKVNDKIQAGSLKIKTRQNILKRHQVDFLQDYYRRKRQQDKSKQQDPKEQQNFNKNSQAKQNGGQKSNDFWNSIKSYVDLGYASRIEEGDDSFTPLQNLDFNDSMSGQSEEQKKSVRDRKSSSSSGDQDDDIFGDQAPTKIVKKKDTEDVEPESTGKVFVDSRIFSRIVQKLGAPHTVYWLIRDIDVMYKVSTYYMDTIYLNQKVFDHLPYIALNRSRFITYSQIQDQKVIDKLKNWNQPQEQVVKKKGKYNNRNKFQHKE